MHLKRFSLSDILLTEDSLNKLSDMVIGQAGDFTKSRNSFYS